MPKQEDATFTQMLSLGRLIRSQIERETTLSLAQLETLRFVYEAGRPSMLEVAHYHRITAPSATSLVDELVRAKLLTRVSDARDRRHVRLTLTSSGRRVLKASMESRKRVIESLLTDLGERDRKEFNRLIGNILAAHTK